MGNGFIWAEMKEQTRVSRLKLAEGSIYPRGEIVNSEGDFG